MLNRKTVALSLVLVLLAVITSACAPGAATVPDREVSISVDTALEAQNAGMAGLMGGQVEWTEAQFSSFLTVLLQQNTGENNPIESITTWFEPGNQIFIRAQLADGVLLGGNTIDLVGTVGVENNHLQVNISEAAANGYSVSGAAVQPVNAWINYVLADPNMGVAVNVETGEGTLTVGLGS
jgi:hypothetical protein